MTLVAEYLSTIVVAKWVLKKCNILIGTLVDDWNFVQLVKPHPILRSRVEIVLPEGAKYVEAAQKEEEGDDGKAET